MQTEQDFFREVTLRVSRRLDVTKMLEDLFCYFRPRMPCDLLQMNYINFDTGELRCLAWVEMQDGKQISHTSHTLFEFPEEAIMVLQKGPPPEIKPPPVEILNIGMPHHHPPHPSLTEGFKKFQLDSYNAMIVHLVIEGIHIGILIIAARPPYAYTPEHAHMIEGVIEPLTIAFSNARRYEDLLRLKDHLADENKSLSQDMQDASGAILVGEFGGLRHVMELVRRVAPLSSPILLLGETGTGKEVLAHAIHAMSPRRDKPFVRVQCGAIPEALLDSELFGHEKGAFTGATALRYGRFERAHGGTIFLDEIGELTLEAQVKLLRILQEKEFERVGGSETLHVDVRVIAATHRNLPEMVREGLFREDLFFRLNVFPLTIPPLRQRREDLPMLLSYFLNRKSRELNIPCPPSGNEEEMAKLLSYDWPGNVRELQNVVERALIISGSGRLRFSDLGGEASSESESIPDGESHSFRKIMNLDEVAAAHIRKAMRLAHGRIQGAGGAADILGIGANTLRARMRKLNIPFGRDSMHWNDEQG